MPAPYRRLPPPGCQAGGGPRPAELAPGADLTCLSAVHDGSRLASCAARSGPCQRARWPGPRYPRLRQRTAARRPHTGPMATQERAGAVQDGADPDAAEAIARDAEADCRAR